MTTKLLDAVARAATDTDVFLRTGTVMRLSGEVLDVSGVNLRPRELAYVDDAGGSRLVAVCTRASGGSMQLSLLERGIVAIGGRATASGIPASAPSGAGLAGRILDGLGRPLDGGGPLNGVRWIPSHAEPPLPLDREPIAEPLPTGVRAIDAFLTLGRGQRAGIFAGSGVGKSTLLGMLARGTAADITVIALIGERGREVRDFIELDLGVEALRKCVVVASTGDNPAAMRLQAASTATAIAEGFRDQGSNVLLLFDSLTRVAMAQRELGLAAGEPPTTKGYPPSVFSLLPHLMERAGPARVGSITAIYTVLVDGEDMDEPIADLTRATLDGHIVLKRALANGGHYPPIDVLSSVSRLMERVAQPEHRAAARALREIMAAYAEARDLINIGAYVSGSDPAVDAAIELLPKLNLLLRQSANEITPFDSTVRVLEVLAGHQPEATLLEGSADELDSAAPEETGDLS
jgi:flagellum-specific ATP synthase